MNTSIATVDIFIIAAYLIGIVAIGIFSTRKQKLNSENYFLAGRGLNWVYIGAALFASNISTIHLTGLAAEGYRIGLVVGNFEWMATFTLILLAIIFAPFYFKTKISTLPEFLEKRFDSRSRTFMAFMAIIGALFIHIGISLYAGAIVFQNFLGLDFRISIIMISVLTAIYTVIGGLKAVVVTENIQTVILLAGSVILTFLSISAVQDIGIKSIEDLKLSLRQDQLKMLHAGDSEIGKSEGYSWYSFFLGYPILGIWYWCTDQTIVQRVLGAKTEKDAQYGPLFAGLLKILPTFLIVLPGTLAFVLFQDQIVDPNDTLPVLINELIPIGLKGVFAAALLAALMSTISAALNSCSSLVAIDILQRIKPEVSDMQMVRVGKISAIVVMLLSIIWSTQAGKFDSIFQAINDLAAAIAPPISTVFLLGIFWRRGTKDAAFYTLIFGFFVGVGLFLLDFESISGEKYLTNIGIPFLMRTWWVFCLCCIFFVVVSLCTAPPQQLQVANTTWNGPRDIMKNKISSIKDPRSLAFLLLLLMVVLYLFFG